MKFDVNKLEWTRKPKEFSISEEKIEIVKWLAHDGQQPDLE